MGLSVRSDREHDPRAGSGWRSWPRRAITWLLLAPVYLWRATAPMRAPRCRYHPSCSSYAVESVRVHGPGRGSMLAARRLGRCHPWQPGGIDPVPPRQHGDRPHRG